MPLHPQVELVLQKIKQAGNPEYWQMTPQQARDFHNQKAAILDAKPEPVFRAEDRTLPGPAGAIPVRVFTPRASKTPLPVLVWLHGGGHVVGSLDSYDSVCRQLALRADCIVVSVDYRLAPEHKFPAAVDDSFAALMWVLQHADELGGDVSRIAIGGDSAGGNLAAVAAILARDAGLPPLAFQLLVYPATAAHPDTQSQQAFSDGYLLTRKHIFWFQNHYLRDDRDREDFRYAPLLCPNLSGLPPALVIVAEYDPLRDEGIIYAECLLHAGNQVELVNYEGMVHAFFSMSGALDVGKQAITKAAAALQQAFRDND